MAKRKMPLCCHNAKTSVSLAERVLADRARMLVRVSDQGRSTVAAHANVEKAKAQLDDSREHLTKHLESHE